jgi:hypothetical protein
MDEPISEVADPRDEIARLEAQIEQLADKVESCRKFMLASRIAIAGGSILVVAILLGLIDFDPTVFFAAVAAILGGFVVLGSNKTTANEAAEQRAEAEAERAALIDAIELRVVEVRPTLH